MPNLLPLSQKAAQSSFSVRLDMECSKPSLCGRIEGITGSRIIGNSVRYQIIWDSLLGTRGVKTNERF